MVCEFIIGNYELFSAKDMAFEVRQGIGLVPLSKVLESGCYFTTSCRVRVRESGISGMLNVGNLAGRIDKLIPRAS